MFVFYSFAPSPHEYTVSRGVPNPKNGENLTYYTPLKSQNFDEILTFLGKFLRGRVLVVRNRVRFCQKLKKARIVAVLLAYMPELPR